MVSSLAVLDLLIDLRKPDAESYYLARHGVLEDVCFRDTDKNSQIVVLKTDPEDFDIVPTVFTIVGQVNPVGSYLQTYASYIRDSKYSNNDDFQSAKVKIVLSPITNTSYVGDLGDDWEKITEFVKAVHPLAFDDKEKKEPAVKTTPLRTHGGLLFQHTLLVPRDGNDNDVDLEPHFTIEGYPVHGEYRTELDQFVSTHKLEALPAVSVDGKAMHPSQYASQLTGAIVRMDFTLENWNIKTANKASLVANIECVTVLVPPPVAPASPSKKRFRDLATRKDLPESPTKKGKSSSVGNLFK